MHTCVSRKEVLVDTRAHLRLEEHEQVHTCVSRKEMLVDTRAFIRGTTHSAAALLHEGS